MRWTALIWALPLVFCTLPAVAQDLDDLDDLDEGVVLEEPFEAGIQPNSWNFSVLFGYRNVSNRLLSAKGIVVDVEDPQDAAFADMELTGAQSFSPQIRLNRTFGRHFALEFGGGFALGDYEQNLLSEPITWVDPESDNTVTATETEKGSYWIWNAEFSGIWYPFGKGTLQPYLIAGAGQNWFSVDSHYIDGTTSGFAFSYGGGLHIVGDDLYSLRLEVRNYHTTLDHNVNPVFIVRPNLNADALIAFPVSELVDIADLSDAEIDAILAALDLDRSVVEGDNAVATLPALFADYEKESFSNLWISIGFSAAF